MAADPAEPIEIPLDVSDLPPPEPMVEILAAARALQHGQALRVTHRREPFPLYGALAEIGCVHRTRRSGPDRFEIRIWRADDAAVDSRLGPPDPVPRARGDTDGGCP